MVPSYVFVILAGLLLSAIIVVIVKAVFFPSDDQKAVPLSDIQEIRELRQSPGPATLRSDPASLSDHLIKENFSSPSVLKPESAKPVLSPSPVVPVQPTVEPNAPLSREVEILKEKLASREKELQGKIESLTQQLAQSVERHKQDAEKLKSQSDQKVLALQQELNEFKNKLESTKNAHAVIEAEFSRAKLSVSEKDMLIQELRDSAETEIASLKEQVLRATEERKSFADSAEKLESYRLENERLRSQLSDLTIQAEKQLSRIEFLEQEQNQKSFEASQTIEKLKKEIDEVHVASRAKINQQLIESLAVVDALKKEKEGWSAERAQVEADLKKISEFNRYLTEKEKILQYELTKSRAQAVGLERICEDFKIQIEQLSKIHESAGS